MSRLHLRPMLLAALLAFTVLDAAPPPSRIVAVGDVHGAADAFDGILQRAGLIDSERRWIGGTAVLVQTGDLLARGTEIRAVLDLLIALEPQAAAAGGQVQVLLGNHEMMELLGEPRDVAPELFQKFADERSDARREQAFQAASRLNRGKPLDKAEWLAAHLPGYVEYREAFSPTGRYGRWLRTKPIIAEIEGTVFLHGGVNPEYTTESVANLNRRARRDLAEWDEGFRWLQRQNLALPFSTLVEVVHAAQAELVRFEGRRRAGEPLADDDVFLARTLVPIVKVDESTMLNPHGPLWFRGYSTWTDEEGSGRVSALLRKYRVKRFVTGHTPQQSGRITSRFGGGLFLIDTGMLNGRFYPFGRPSALEIVGETVTPLYLEQ